MRSYFMSTLLLQLSWIASSDGLYRGTCGQNFSRVFAENIVDTYPDKLEDSFKDCAVGCLKNKHCETFSHVRGFCNQYARNDKLILFDAKCKTNDDCSYKHGFCLEGLCSCSIGFSYNFENNTCVTACATYGSRFSKYKNSAIKHHNTKTLLKPSLKNCMRACINEIDFVCINAEFRSQTCSLCNVTWAEILPAHRLSIKSSWVLMYRHCY